MKRFDASSGAGAPLWMGVVLLISLVCGGSALAQSAGDGLPVTAQVAAEPTVVDEQNALLGEIAREKKQIERLQTQLLSSEGLAAEILTQRQDRLWISLFRNTLLVARSVLESESTSGEVTAAREEVVADLRVLPDEAYTAMGRLRDAIEFPAADVAPQVFVVADQKLLKRELELNEIFRVLLDYLELAPGFGLEIESQRQALIDIILESGANRSAFLELAISNAQVLSPAAATLPSNTDLADALAAAEARIVLAGRNLNETVGLMNKLELDTTHYRQQIIKVTGEITTDVLDIGVFSKLIREWGQNIGDVVVQDGLQLLFQLLLVLVILGVALQLARLAEKLVVRGLDSAGLNISSLLRRMIISTTRNLVVLLGVLIAISQLGISLGPLLAGLGIAGFVVGFALQDTLGNFASGILILLYRPFDVGDVVEAGGVLGEVRHMSLVNTTFMTFDNQRLVVPNNQIWGSVIKNVTAQATRRVDLVFGIAYDQDIDAAEAVLREVVEACPRVLKEPAPNIRVHELADSSVNLIVRPWVKTEDYWDTYWYLTKAVKQRFDKENIAIPFPQRDVHLINQQSG